MGGNKRELKYEPNPKHCEPITAEVPGTKCPAWSIPLAESLLRESVVIGTKRYATRDGVAFVGQMTRTTDDMEIWHGYPEAWDRIDPGLKSRWHAMGKVTKKELRRLRTRADVIEAFGGKLR